MEEQMHPTPGSSDALIVDPALAQLQAQNQLLLTLFRMSARLAAELETPDFPAQAVRMVVEAVPNVDRVALWFFNRADKRLRLAAAYSTPEAPALDAAGLAGAALRLDEGALGQSLAQERPLLLPDTASYLRSVAALEPHNAARFDPFAAQLPPVLTTIYLPLVLGSIPIGVLELFDLDSDSALTADDLPLLQAFADQLAVVVRNAQIYAEMSAQHRRLQAFDAVVTAITNASDLPQMLEQALSVTLYVVGAERGLMLLLSGSVARIEISYHLPEDAFGSGQIVDVERLPFNDVLRAGQSTLIALPEVAPWSGLAELGVDALALVPMLAGGTVVGALVIALDGGAPVRLDWPSLLALGNQIGIAVANYQLYDASQRERRQLAGVIASIAEGVVICDRDGRLLLSNAMGETMLGLTLDAGMSLAELAEALAMRSLDGQLLHLDATPLARALRGDVYQNYEVRVTAGTGNDLVMSCSGAPLLADDGQLDGAVIVFRDMTAYRQHEALRDEFVAVAAHELRAPLAAVKGYTDLLLQREASRPEAAPSDRRGIMLLSRQIEHLVQLVDNLLNVSRLDAGQLELYLQPVDLISLIEACIDRISIGDNNHQFVFDGPPSLQVICDQLRIQQVFTNLLSNSARYSAAGTQISVEVWTEACTIENGVIIGSGGSGRCIVVAVRDQGVGMSPEVQAKVFDRYYRANTATAASGLGLGVYLSREIVLRHGGRIWLESAVGQGTAFYVMLPIGTDSAG
jgi:two-component system phosphate regulon sensor histidine kinase PhoR